MASFNKIMILGNLTRDPEVKYTAKGTAIAKFGLATSRTWRDDAGQTKEEVTFFDVDAFGSMAENIGKFFKKGRPIFIEGRMRTDSWDDKQTNQKRSKLVVVADTFHFVDSGNRAEGEQPVGAPPPAASRPAPQAPPPPKPAPAAPLPEDMPPDDELPF